MSEGFSLEAIIAFLRRNLFLSGVSAIGLILLAFGFFGVSMFQPQEESVVYESGSGEEKASDEGDSGQARMTAGKTNSNETIIIDIAGAVKKPGVYEVKADSRVQDVLAKADGLAEQADAQGIAKTMNLAAKVADGMKLYFPFKGENVSQQAAVLGSSQSVNLTNSSGMSSTQTGGLINLNLASESELESLPGIGAVTAQKIIKSRPYGSVQDVKDKKVVGESVYSKIKDLVTVN